MKKIFLSIKIIILLFSLSCCSFTKLSHVKKADKVALIVGISKYPKNSGWSEINGENDIDLIKEALKLRGFSESNIYVLKGSMATKENIKNKLKTISKKIEPGGFFFFHFSGHGQQVEDITGKDEIDQYDESIVPYDAHLKINSNYSGEKHIIDDDFGNYLLPIRKQLGTSGQVLVLIDACHSGTISRGENDKRFAPVRGTNQPLKFTTNNVKGIVGMDKKTGFSSMLNSKYLASQIIISATRPNETSKEYFINGKFYGPLSYAFANVFPQMDKRANYQILFEKIQQEILTISRHQAPTIEGNLNQVVGQNTLRPIHNFHSVLSVEKTIQELTINAGKFLKIYEGTELLFYPSVVDTLEGVVATGKVIHSENFYSKVEFQLKKGKSANDLKRAYIKKHHFGNLNLRVGVDVTSKDIKDLLLKKINQNPTIKIVQSGSEVLIQQQGDKVIIRTDETIIQEFKMDKYSSKEEIINTIIEKTLLDFTKTKYLRKLESSSPKYKLSARFILVDATQNSNGEVIKSTPKPDERIHYNDEHQLKIPLGTVYQLEITNHGSREAYLTILDIQPDGKINVAIPYPFPIKNRIMKPEDYSIQPKQKIILEEHYWGMGEPKGLEQYFIIGTNNPIDLRSLSTRTRGDSRGVNIFEDLILGDWVSYQKSRGTLPPIIPEEMNIEEILIEIVPDN